MIISGSRIRLYMVMASIAVLYFFYSYFTPYCIDDIMFMGLYKDYNGGDSGFSFKALADFAAEVRANDNGRLSNILSPIATLMVPRGLFAVVSALGVAFMYYLMARMARISPSGRGVAVLILWLSSLVFLPWRNSIIVNDYLLNYLYPSLGVLAFILLLQKSAKEKLDPFLYLCSIVIALAGGWFHEGFSAPVCFGLAAVAVQKRFQLPVQWWVQAIVFGLAAVWAATAPGIFQRMEVEAARRSLFDQVKFVVTCLPAFSLFIFIVCCTALNPRLRKITFSLFRSQFFLILFVAAMVGAMIVLSIDSEPRSSWPIELFSMIGVAAYFPRLKWRPSRALSTLGFGTLWIVGVLFFCNVIRWQYRLWNQHVEIEQKLAESKTGTLFYDIIDPRSIRKETLFLPLRNTWVSSFQYNVINDTVTDKNKYYSVVPSVLESYSDSAATTIEGSARLKLYNGVLVGPDEGYVFAYRDRYADEYPYDFTLADGTKLRGVEAFRNRFKTADGEYRMYIYPHMSAPASPIVRADKSE